MVLQEYENGATFAAIARKYGHTNGFWIARFRNAGIRRRPCGRPRKVADWQDQLAQIRAWRAEGIVWAEIGRRLKPDSKRPPNYAQMRFHFLREREAGLKREPAPYPKDARAGETA